MDPFYLFIFFLLRSLSSFSPLSVTLLATTASCCRLNAGESDLIVTANRLMFISGTRNSCCMPRIVIVSTRAWVRRVILQPLQGLHAARKILARKIPKNFSFCFVDAQNRMVLEQRKFNHEYAINVYNTRCIMVHPKVWATVRKWLQNWNFQYLVVTMGNPFFCNGNRRSMCNIQRSL
ncbi:unnamed protein product [Malus baccata var. baccata]